MTICHKCKKTKTVRTVHYCPAFEKGKLQFYQYWYCLKCNTRTREDLLK